MAKGCMGDDKCDCEEVERKEAGMKKDNCFYGHMAVSVPKRKALRKKASRYQRLY